MPPHLRPDDQDDDQDDRSQDPSEDLPGHRRGVAGFAAQFVRPASPVRDIDVFEMLGTAQGSTTLTLRGRGRGAGVASGPCRGAWGGLVRMTTLRTRLGLGRDRATARGTIDEGHGSLQRWLSLVSVSRACCSTIDRTTKAAILPDLEVLSHPWSIRLSTSIVGARSGPGPFGKHWYAESPSGEIAEVQTR